LALRDVRTPVALIAITLAVVAGVIAWLASDGPADHAGPSRIDIVLGEAKPPDSVAIAPAKPQASPTATAAPEPSVAAPPPAAAPSPPPQAAAAPAAPAAVAPPAPPAAPPLPPAQQRESRVVEAMLVPPKLPRAQTGPALSPAPDPKLVRASAVGPLPIIGADGRAPWKVYARPFDAADTRPRIAIVVAGLGLSGAATEAAIQGLPGAITLAFAPYADDLGSWLTAARAAGHEVLINVPMEPLDYPRNDPGPLTLLTSLDSKANVERLEWMLGRAVGYVGIADFMGSRFTASRRNLRPVLQSLAERGLMFVDSRSSGDSVVPEVAQEVGVPWVQSTQSLDEVVTRSAIDARLAELERRARDQGRAVGVGAPFPATLERVAQWAMEADKKGFLLVPVSALANEKKAR
jgi:polysaccharide deacetylase 2 family uncharacterized protein YibQ